MIYPIIGNVPQGLAALQLVVLSLPRAPAVLLRSGSLLALGSASQWRPPSVA